MQQDNAGCFSIQEQWMETEALNLQKQEKNIIKVVHMTFHMRCLYEIYTIQVL